MELDEDPVEAAESAEVAAAAAVLKAAKESAATRAAVGNRKPTDLTAAREAIKVVVNKGYHGWSARGTLKVDTRRMLAIAVKLW